MHTLWRYAFVALLLFSIFHLGRDVLQYAGVENIFTTLLHRKLAWCDWYCDPLIIPYEIATIAGGAFVLWRDRIGIVGVIALGFPPLLLIATLLP
ncbi:MAG: hypothetical protein HYS26_04195 [Candidatus Kaiserbacteria bacterium]|nr:MAG: hypothetical protein HYS26_04195 [Candidatus Kaiserbacteria bacterium]